jgi:hypothetical protein
MHLPDCTSPSTNGHFGMSTIFIGVVSRWDESESGLLERCLEEDLFTFKT